MADPTTVNKALIIPLTGSDVGTWGAVALNPDFVSIDGMLGGVATVGLSSTNVILTAPAGTISPGAGPTQSQNAVLRFTGALTANVQVTLPLPGFVIVENLTSGPWVVTFAAPGAGEVIATPQGSRMQIYNDGTNVRFMGDVSSFPGKIEFAGGVSAVPAWMSACTVQPFLLANGATFLIATYPALASAYGTAFGGDGVTTSAVPDLQGRYPLAYDGTGTRITVAGCGLNGQTLGAAGGAQNKVVLQANLPNITLAVDIPAGQGSHTHPAGSGQFLQFVGLGGSTAVINGANALGNPTTAAATLPDMTGTAPLGGSGTALPTVPPAQVSGVWLIKT